MIYIYVGILVLCVIIIAIQYCNRVKIQHINQQEKERYNQEINVLDGRLNGLRLEYNNYQKDFQEKIELLEAQSNFKKEEIDRDLQDYQKSAEEEKIKIGLQKTNELMALEEQIKDFKSKRQSIIDLEQKEAKDKDNILFHSLQLPEQVVEDINIILQLTNKISNPQILYKIIWSEYYQKPVKDLVNRLGASSVSGIYKITCNESKKIYIGRSVNIGDRWVQHVKSALEIGTIAKTQLYTEMKKYGIHNFTFEILEKCDKDKLSEREKFYISLYKTNEWGLNENNGG